MIKNFKIFEKTDKGKEIIYTFKTKSISYVGNKTYEHDIYITEGKSSFILSISTTPGSWYVETLLEGDTTQPRLSIQGNDWYCDNWQDVMEELLEILPELEMRKDANKYNL